MRNYASQSADFKPGVLITGLLFVIIGTGLVLQAFISHLRFTHDSIEQRTLFRQKSLPFSAIRGRRDYIRRDSDGVPTHYLRVVPNSNRLPTLEFTKNYALDDAFFHWFYELPDLNERDEPRSNFSIFSSR